MTERYNSNISGINPTTLTGISTTLGNLLITSGSLNATFNSNTLGNLYTTGGNVGINNTAPSCTLDVSGGSIKTSNYLLQPNVPSFRVYFNGNYTSLITNGTVVYNTGNYYSTSTGRFTAPVSGFYLIRLEVGSSNQGAWAAICKNSTTFTYGNLIVQPMNGTQQTGTAVYHLAVNDYICASVQGGGTLYGDTNSGFGAFLLARTY